MADMVNILVDGTPIAVEKGTLVIEAARRLGIMIPHFCYHPKIKPDANCRMCLVEVEKMPKLQTSCSTLVAEGMAVRTNTAVVEEAHKSVLEFILANHPLDCPICDQGGRCDLQDFSHRYTPTKSDFLDVKRVFQKEYFSPLIDKEMNRCVQCLRCVRYCDEVIDAKALAPIGRGSRTEISHFTSHQLDCEFCGGCVQICPVGAFTNRLSDYEFRPWMMKRADTVCGYCGDGCTITLQSREDELIEVISSFEKGRNSGDLCARGYFGYQFVNHPDRLTMPLVRQPDGRFEPTTWEDVLPLLAERFTQVKLAYGSEAVGGLITSRGTNEDLYVFQKFMRLAIGSNHLDSAARFGHVNAVEAMRRVQGTNRWTVSYEDIVNADCLLLIGTQITWTNPIAGLKVKEAVKKHGAKLLTIEAMQPSIETTSNIANLSTTHLTVEVGRHPAAVHGLLKAVFDEGVADNHLAATASGYVDRTRAAVSALPYPEGMDEATLRTIARTFAGSRRGVILIGQDLLQSPGGYEASVNLMDLLLLLGKLSEKGWGLAPLTEENNEQGAIEMGATADYFPGAASLDDAAARTRIASAWKESPPVGAGMRMLDMLEAARSGKLKAMLIVGENPARTLPASAKPAEALGRLEFLVVQELFLTETAKLAHVVLPASSYAEKSGSFTNSEGCVQKVRAGLEPLGGSRPDWEILSAVSVLMGYPLEYGDAAEILKEIRAVIPGYRVLGATPEPARVDRPAMDRYVGGGFAEDMASRYRATSNITQDSSYPWSLWVGQSLFHSGKLSTMAKGLLEIQKEGRLYMNPADLQRMQLAEGEMVTLTSVAGEARVPVGALGRIPRGILFFPESFKEAIAGLLTMTPDAVTGVPYHKQQRVAVHKT
ncbi:MAG: NADH-quinone oxidoreductase subunit NuoG [Nitrospirae bacterium]|nr:MAG: NADH-quinone oxidoreductase subunit NuoG [Nitrospirota bacterium]